MYQTHSTKDDFNGYQRKH